MCRADRLVSRLRIDQFQPSSNQVAAARDMGGGVWWLQTLALNSDKPVVPGLSCVALKTKHNGRLRTENPPGGLFQ